MQGAYDFLTIWNCWKDPAKKAMPSIWHRFFLEVRCKFEGKAVYSQTGAGESQAASILRTQLASIPENPYYLPPGQWAALGPEARGRRYTLQENDFIGLGEVIFDITGVEPYTTSKLRALDGVFQIKMVQDNTRVGFGRHFIAQGV